MSTPKRKPPKPKKAKGRDENKIHRQGATSIAMCKAALKSNAGILAYAAAELGVSRQNLDRRVRANPDLQEFVRELGEEMLDRAEKGVFAAIAGTAKTPPDMNTIRWFLERRGKSRGYANKTEVEHKISDDELEALVHSFGGDIDRLRAFRAAIAPAEETK